MAAADLAVAAATVAAGGRHPGGAGGLSIGTILLLGVIGYATGIDPLLLIRGVETFQRPAAPCSAAAGSRSVRAPRVAER